jgi:hypothetical protein
VDQSPVRLAGHRVYIALPQKALIVRLLERLYRRGKLPAVLPDIDLDGAYILVAAMHGLDLTLPLQLLRHLGRGNAEHQQNKKDCNDQTHEHETLLTVRTMGAIRAPTRIKATMPKPEADLLHLQSLNAPTMVTSADYYSPYPPP